MSNATLSATTLRSELGDFSSIICFRALVVGIEHALGEKAGMIAMLSAGRERGKQLVESLGLEKMPICEALPALQEAIGVNGTRLCIVDKVEESEESIKVYCRETICSAGEPQGSERKLTFTQGAIHGAVEALTGLRLRGQQVESVLRGGTHDVIEFTRLG
jgi:hypothetical protein